MGWLTELYSWLPPPRIEVATVPVVGGLLPDTQNLIPGKQATILAFLRHCGCPFAEQTFRRLNDIAHRYPDLCIIAISHSDQPSTARWLASLELPTDTTKVDGSKQLQAPPNAITDPATPLPQNLFLISDAQRKLFGQFGLSTSGLGHVLSPSVMRNVFKVGKEEGIWNKPTESGYRWQTAGGFAFNDDGKITWVWVAKTADDVGDFDAAVKSLIQ